MPTLRERFPIQKRKILKKSFVRVAAVLFFALLLSMIFFAIWEALVIDADVDVAQPLSSHAPELVGGWLAVVVLAILYTPIYQYLYFRNYFYDIDDRNVIIRKGIVSRKELTLPLVAITDVSVDQDLFDVLLGLYDVHISTPTAESGKFAHIDGVNRQGAAALKQLLLDRIHERRSN